MYLILSPSKTMTKQATPHQLSTTQPQFIAQAAQLMAQLRPHTVDSLSALYQCSSAVAQEAHQMIASWQAEGGHPAIYSYTGMVYMGLDIETMPAESLPYLQARVRILSALYGIIRPLDTIHPYRLDFKTTLTSEQTLYEFWQPHITPTLNEQLGPEKLLLNLASNEYSKLVQKKQLDGQIIDVAFKEKKEDGKLRTIGVYAKKARGLMARFVVQNQVTTLEQLKTFRSDGYSYNITASKPYKLVFSRPYPN